MKSSLLSLADQNVNIALTFSSSHKAMECYNKENRAASNNAMKFTYYNMLHCLTVTMTIKLVIFILVSFRDSRL